VIRAFFTSLWLLLTKPAKFGSELRHMSDLLATIDAAHPGWHIHVQTQSFKEWLHRQTAEVQGYAASMNPARAILLLDLYKAAHRLPARKP
jgi:hypothetical protein